MASVGAPDTQVLLPVFVRRPHTHSLHLGYVVSAVQSRITLGGISGAAVDDPTSERHEQLGDASARASGA